MNPALAVVERNTRSAVEDKGEDIGYERRKKKDQKERPIS